MPSLSLFWFRRDLRLHDNRALYNALQKGKVLPFFIFDTNILNKLQDIHDKRITFIYNEVLHLKTQLEKINSTLLLFYGEPLTIIKKITQEYPVTALYFNKDYEPYAIVRDNAVTGYLNKINIPAFSFKDQVIFEENEIVKDNQQPYTVFTPYSRKWKERFLSEDFKLYPSENLLNRLHQTEKSKTLSLNDIGFKSSHCTFPLKEPDLNIIKNYHNTRDIPSINGTSRLSVHLRFGTISIRQLAKIASVNNETYLNELIWREFYMMILWHFPQTVEQSFKKEYDLLEWNNNEKEFKRWCAGNTGYPIVDAGMRQLNETGFMHNRLRMITASFLTKHLLIDWRWGEAYFAEKLLDYEQASNVGGWQWAASTGCDAVPYFRIFNPELQTQKFDPDYKYIKQWVPEFDTPYYPKPIVNHQFARERALQAFKKIKR
ncbi:MAG TPA: deoxyribodipyrimidine photo-lyase [Bacteroidales bacterium]|nr:deoxyribodipyrimidine photo-lyase [Bacteroidales bacterium]